MPILYCYYGDDFTGSTDVLQQLAAGNIPSVLFLRPPSQADLDDFPDALAIGLAGDSRSQSPEWMRQHLPERFEQMRRLNARVNHYKVCSTFDSGVNVGSIGCVLELAQKAFPEAPCLPVLPAAPLLGRYVCFGNLFATTPSGEIARIDRHPMRHHPVTPMEEADLRRHLQHQTSLPMDAVELPTLLTGGEPPPMLRAGGVILFDGLDDRTQSVTGRWLWDISGQSKLFVVASSGLTAALVDTWRDDGALDGTLRSATISSREDASTHPLLVVSGSCSLATAVQIRWALENDFAGFQIAPDSIGQHSIPSIARNIAAALAEGRSVVAYTAMGEPTSDRLGGAALGEYLGDLTRAVLELQTTRRLMLCGGDTSSHAIRRLGIHALTWLADACMGVPLCRVHGNDGALHELELILKGGQMGGPSFFEEARHIST